MESVRAPDPVGTGIVRGRGSADRVNLPFLFGARMVTGIGSIPHWPYPPEESITRIHNPQETDEFF